MLGIRGVRLGLLYPAIYEMQIRAIFGALAEAREEHRRPVVEILVPLVASGASWSWCQIASKRWRALSGSSRGTDLRRWRDGRAAEVVRDSGRPRPRG